jgi:hypothetical protein
MSFAIICILGLIVGRKLGWALSKAWLYTARSDTRVIAVCVAWGLWIALGVRVLILWQQPHWALKYILGYGVGAYIASPNFGLISESTIPPDAQRRHSIIGTVPVVAYILASVLLALFLV